MRMVTCASMAVKGGLSVAFGEVSGVVAAGRWKMEVNASLGFVADIVRSCF